MGHPSGDMEDSAVEGDLNCGSLALEVLEVQSIIMESGTGQHPGRHGAGGAESSTYSYKVSLEQTGFQAAERKVAQSPPTE